MNHRHSANPYYHIILKKPLVTGLVVFLLFIFLTQWMTFQRYRILKDTEDRELLNHANWTKERLHQLFSYSFSTTRTLAFLVNQYGVPRDFDYVAKELLKLNPYIDAVQLVQGGKITHVYPLHGNEAAVGLDILKDTMRRSGALAAMNSRDFYIAGPIHLFQGGEGLVARLPIYKKDKFWGFSAVIIKISTLLKSTGIDTIENGLYSYQLSQVNYETGKEEFYLKQNTSFNGRHFIPVQFSNAEWRLYITPLKSVTAFNVLVFASMGLLLSLLGGCLAWYVASQPDKLSRMVEDKKQEILAGEQVFRTTLERVSDGFVAMDKELRFTYANKRISELTRKPVESLIGQKAWDVFPNAIGSATYKAIREALATQTNQSHVDYFEDRDIWLENDIYPSPDGLTVFVRDITQAVKAQKQIGIEKQLSDTIIDGLPGIFYLITNEGKYIRWNKNLEMVTGYSTDELEVMHPLAFFDESEKERVMKKVKDVFETGKSEIEAEIYSKDGTKHFYHFNGWRIRYQDNDCLIGIGIDISRRRDAEAQMFLKMAEIKERVKELNCLYLVSEITNKTDITIEEMLQQTVQIIPGAYQFPEITCARITYDGLTYHSPGFIETPWKQQSVISSGKISTVEQYVIEVCYKEERLAAFDGPFLKEERNLIDSIAKILSNSIERQHAITAIHLSEEKYRYLFDNSPALILIWDLEELKLLEVNRQATELYGYSKEEFIGMPVFQYRPQEDYDSIKKFASQMLQGETPVMRRIWRHFKKNGELMYMDITSHFMIYNGRKAILSLAKDITEQYKAEEKLRKSYEEIRLLNTHLQTIREEERTTIAREIHDELGQLLTSIKMDISWLAKKTDNGEVTQNKFSEVIRLIDETVKTVRRISGNLRPGILDDLGLVAALEWQSSEFKKRSGIHCYFETALNELDIDTDAATGFFRIFQESLTNVMRHSGATKVNASLELIDELLILTIRDNGTGLSSDKQSGKRTLGLIGMRERAYMMGGEFHIESPEAGGTVVTVKVPIKHSGAI